ncbi:GNAT family N-acetyltransferase [Paenibacillus sp. YPG26]|uniref:GNAT family N-acetyltransferase n=1 Tax=Paenibacillus sp. YPG26 TaxID=2878915 RepID=UPI00203CFCA2|nr:GNAT family N-acetyltransferase [Paenibacillus sp. YPG26]USB33037.1 GNAT family N-acetyltransferase [Paenibacillus sp. YPG26]
MYDMKLLEQWAEFNRRKWGCRAAIRSFQASRSNSRCESLFFYTRRGKLYLPPLNLYHPTLFQATPTSKAHRISTQWHEAARQMIAEMCTVMGTAGFCLPPGFTDVRPFIWQGFEVVVKYTYYLDFPFSLENASGDIRSRVKRASSEGYYVRRTANMKEVHECLTGTEARQGFSHNLSLRDLELAQELLGENAFRCYVCYSREGEPVSASAVLVLDPDRPQWWIAGSKAAHLSKGVVQLLQSVLLQELSDLGMKGFDFAGANIPSVAKSKAPWGGNLVPYYLVKKRVFKDVLRVSWNWWRFRSNRLQRRLGKAKGLFRRHLG